MTEEHLPFKNPQDQERWQQINKIVAFFDHYSLLAVLPALSWLIPLIFEDWTDIGWCGTGHLIRISRVIILGTPVAIWALYGVIRQWAAPGLLAVCTRILGSIYLILYAEIMLGG